MGKFFSGILIAICAIAAIYTGRLIFLGQSDFITWLILFADIIALVWNINVFRSYDHRNWRKRPSGGKIFWLIILIGIIAFFSFNSDAYGMIKDKVYSLVENIGAVMTDIDGCAWHNKREPVLKETTIEKGTT